MKHQAGCLICGQELHYNNKPVTAKCIYCGKESETLIICPDGHFVCDDCHRADGLKAVENYCLASNLTDPILMANELMNIDFISLHGPEHHALVPAVLVTAYKNATGQLDYSHIKTAINRGAMVQGGMCGNFGACGAGIGTGIALSVINGTTPLSKEDWGIANQMTSRALMDIGKKEGPRCCKRCTWTALEAAIDFIREVKNVDLKYTNPQNSCTHYARNKQCQGKKCSYFPAYKGDENNG